MVSASRFGAAPLGDPAPDDRATGRQDSAAASDTPDVVSIDAFRKKNT